MGSFRILFIDSYDSFTYNVVRLIEQQSTVLRPVQVTTIHNDTFKDIAELIHYLPLFDGIVIGPGPGNPVNGVKDIGIVDALFRDPRVSRMPILGICLGFQAMCYSQGAAIEVLDTIKHGQVYDMVVADVAADETLLKGYPKSFKSTRYHSLHVSDIKSTSSIVPLAYTTDENGKLLMAARIQGKPWYGVQYHPESCCSEVGDLLFKNFLDITQTVDRPHGHTLNEKDIERLNNLRNTIDISPIYHKSIQKENTLLDLAIKQYEVTKDSTLTLKIADELGEKCDKFIMASSTISANRGEWSIIALPSETSKVFTHYESIKKTTIYNWKDTRLRVDDLKEQLGEQSSVENEYLTIVNQGKETFWKTLGDFMKRNMIDTHHDIPFIGGLVGILGYEMGSYIHSEPIDNNRTLPTPDAKLVYIEDSIIINHRTGHLYAISLSGNFPPAITTILKDIVTNSEFILSWEDQLPADITYDIVMPNKNDYTDAFTKCQEYMHKGDSYEMCLTTQTVVTPSKRLSAWRIFQTLVQRNPAPFSSFFEFDDIVDNVDKNLCLISTSPERFLKWDNMTCELRPIKGTVKKSNEMTLQKATEILKTPKEFGENLMILDLIRNDLYELLPDVSVEEFMSVEEYKTVYQLVSVVKAFGLNKSIFSGMDILKYSLPPGSMTGAPKKITVELLQDKIENTLNRHVNNSSRGVYSGVTGYWSANGSGDWSVNIRCMYSYDSGDSWQLGAGGAITVLSTLDGEMEEMYTKLESALQVFM